MTRGEADFYILPSTWCETCERQVTCEAMLWEVDGEQLATFVCPGCGQTLGVGLHGETSWSPRRTGRQRRASHSQSQS